jgi:hypothetical protein
MGSSPNEDKKRDEVLKRLLETPPKPHRPKQEKGRNSEQERKSKR